MSVLSDSPNLTQAEIHQPTPLFAPASGYANNASLPPYATVGVPMQPHIIDGGLTYSAYTHTPNPPHDYHYPSSPPPGFQSHAPVYHAYTMPPNPPIQYRVDAVPEHDDPELRQLSAALEERRQTLARNPGMLQPSHAAPPERKLFPAPPSHIIALDSLIQPSQRILFPPPRWYHRGSQCQSYQCPKLHGPPPKAEATHTIVPNWQLHLRNWAHPPPVPAVS